MPVIKVATRSDLARRWHDLMDINAGRIADGEASIEDVGWEMFRLMLEVASGRRVAFDTIGAVLTDASWLRVEVAHEAHRPGTALAVEVVLPRGSPRATVQVGDLEVGPQQGHP